MNSTFWDLRVALLTLVLVGCGGAGPHSTDPVRLTRSATGDLSSHGWGCAIEIVSIDDQVIATVTPASLYLELRPGPCNDPRAVVGASSTGMLKVKVGRGSYHVDVGNPSDAAVRYSLTVEYVTPSI